MQQRLYGRHAAGVIMVTGTIFTIGTLIDFFILWVVQRGVGLQWEFVATTQTMEGIPRIILGLGLLYLGAYIRRSESGLLYKSLGFSLLLLGLASGALLTLLVVNYSTMIGAVDPNAVSAFRATTAKAASLGVLYVLTLVPLGAWGLRAPS